MVEAYGLAAAYLSELRRRQDEAKAHYDRGLGTVSARPPGVITRLATALFRAASQKAGQAAAQPAASCGDCAAPGRAAA